MNRIVAVMSRVCLAGALGVGLGQVLIGDGSAKHVIMKVSGYGPDCPWSKVLPSYSHSVRIAQAAAQGERSLRVTDHDGALGVSLVHVGSDEEFWLKDSDTTDAGKWLLPYLLADHTDLANYSGFVRSGDTVIDCGAHVGVFSRVALNKGAAKVIAVEPDPTNAICLRRNLAAFIKDGRAIVYEKGVWSSETHLTLREAETNSGGNTLVLSGEQFKREITITVTTIDRLVSELMLPRVDFIKMDIEGAEREALKGAESVLKTWRPRLMLDSYHRADDLPAFRQVIRSVVPSYVYACAHCEMSNGVLAPHVTFWQAE